LQFQKESDILAATIPKAPMRQESSRSSSGKTNRKSQKNSGQLSCLFNGRLFETTFNSTFKSIYRFKTKFVVKSQIRFTIIEAN
jgi:hypothetical protein